MWKTDLARCHWTKVIKLNVMCFSCTPMLNLSNKFNYILFVLFFKDYNNIGKFLNRILGMEVQQQNALFQYFSDTLAAVIQEAKKNGRYDMGILGKTVLIFAIVNHLHRRKLGQKMFSLCLIIQRPFSESSVCSEGWISFVHCIERYQMCKIFLHLFCVRSWLWWWEGEEGRLQEIPYTGLYNIRTRWTVHSKFKLIYLCAI